MCGVCGCGVEHEHEHGETRRVAVERAVLARNDRLAADNRAWLAARGVAALNLVSSPGAGKTTLLERTLSARPELGIAVVEGDQATEADARRIRAAGARAVQINTGTVCHLDAAMVQRALTELDPEPGSLVMLENVGNLVCPALFDLGEIDKVVLVSVAEGDDKPEKYPHVFRASSLLVVTKIDLLPYVDFDVERCADRARRINPALGVLRVSAKTGEGIDAWLDYLSSKRPGTPAPA